MSNSGGKKVTVNDVVHHFAYGKVKEWMRWAGGEKPGPQKGRIVLQILIHVGAHLALPISFKSQVRFEYVPFYQVSLN